MFYKISKKEWTFPGGHEKTMFKHNDGCDVISVKKEKMFLKNANLLLF